MIVESLCFPNASRPRVKIVRCYKNFHSVLIDSILIEFLLERVHAENFLGTCKFYYFTTSAHILVRKILPHPMIVLFKFEVSGSFYCLCSEATYFIQLYYYDSEIS